MAQVSTHLTALVEKKCHIIKFIKCATLMMDEVLTSN